MLPLDRLEFENYEEFVLDIINVSEKLEYDFTDISVIAKYNDTRQVIKELLNYGYDIVSVDLHEENSENYYDEYIISITSGNEIWCEKFKRKNGYFTNDSDITYILDDCSSKVIPYCESDIIYEVCVGEDDCDADCDDISGESTSSYVSRTKDGTPVGFSKSWNTTEDGVTCYFSFSHYTDNTNALREVAQKFGVEL